MKKQEFENLKDFLIERGYKEYKQTWNNEDYILCKGFHREDNKWSFDRSGYQIIISVYDYSLKPEYWSKLPESYRDYVGLEIHVDVSRTVDERFDLTMFWEDDTSIQDVEIFAESFYEFILKEVPKPINRILD